MSTLKSFWLSYDFGLRGSYQQLYTWLDKVKAKECGPSLAYFQFPIKRSENPKNIIRREFQKNNIIFGANDRVYLIWSEESEDSPKKIKGGFLHGNRKTPVWRGYFNDNLEDIIDE